MGEPCTAESVAARVAREMDMFAAGVDASAFRSGTVEQDPVWRASMLAAFRDVLIEPSAEMVSFSGGFQNECWAITRTLGDYHVVFMPKADYFSLVLETQIGPIDISVHGSAIAVFSTL